MSEWVTTKDFIYPAYTKYDASTGWEGCTDDHRLKRLQKQYIAYKTREHKGRRFLLPLPLIEGFEED